ncbi:MAG: glutamate formimidoyltransferase [Nanoarchaeota archaeon]|nr:glutamate formimidoyltransferase [Nanoarchaeota archaeon]MCG2718128.1 glutamate formimidoyltransferase [Nanoarchaeota archaeon]
MKLIECVPNFSEGRDKDKIDEISKAIGLKAKLLNVESDYDHNRTVITFAGKPKEVLKSAYEGIKKASELIDMSKHTGAHPRIGAADIIPFIPLQGAKMKDCVKIANKLGGKVGKLGIPVYIYSEAAKKEERKSQSNIRKGQYEGLEQKMKQKEWKPDYGPKTFNAKSGATIIGARKILIAYNVFLSNNDLQLAKDISRSIRESSGGFKKIQAAGMMVDGLAQVSMNFLDYETTGVHTVYDEIVKLSNGQVKGSELIGLMPKQAFIDVGKHYYPKEKDEDILIEKAIEKLSFKKIGPFDKDKKIIEYMI